MAYAGVKEPEVGVFEAVCFRPTATPSPPPAGPAAAGPAAAGCTFLALFLAGICQKSAGIRRDALAFFLKS